MTIVDDDVCAWGESRLDINWISSSDTKMSLCEESFVF